MTTLVENYNMTKRNPNIVKYEKLIESIVLDLLKKGDLYGRSTNDIKTLGSMSDAVVKVISEDSELNEQFLSLGLNYKLTTEEIKQIKERDPSYPMKGRIELNVKIYKMAKKNGYCVTHPNYPGVLSKKLIKKGKPKICGREALYGLPELLQKYVIADNVTTQSPQLAFTQTESNAMSESIGVSNAKSVDRPKESVTKTVTDTWNDLSRNKDVTLLETTVPFGSKLMVTYIDDSEELVSVKIMR